MFFVVQEDEERNRLLLKKKSGSRPPSQNRVFYGDNCTRGQKRVKEKAW